MTRMLALSIVAVLGVPAQEPPEQASLAAFTRTIETYVQLHRHVEASLPKLEVSPDAESIRRTIDIMHAAMWAVRRDARAGDVFTPGVAAMFRRLIAEATAGACDVDTLVEEMEQDAEDSPAPLVVNGAFPWARASATPASILGVLPALPPELEYRMVGGDLALVDLHANLVVDLFPGVLAGC
jgi:hypothetical protein